MLGWNWITKKDVETAKMIVASKLLDGNSDMIPHKCKIVWGISISSTVVSNKLKFRTIGSVM